MSLSLDQSVHYFDQSLLYQIKFPMSHPSFHLLAQTIQLDSFLKSMSDQHMFRLLIFLSLPYLLHHQSLANQHYCLAHLEYLCQFQFAPQSQLMILGVKIPLTTTLDQTHAIDLLNHHYLSRFLSVHPLHSYHLPD